MVTWFEDASIAYLFSLSGTRSSSLDGNADDTDYTDETDYVITVITEQVRKLPGIAFAIFASTCRQ